LPGSHALAASIALIARADRGEFDQSLADMKQFLDQRAATGIPQDRRLPGPLVCAVGEAYLQRLVRGGQIDIARQVCRLALSSDNPGRVVQNYFSERLARFDMVGKPAPAIDGTDVDGKPVAWPTSRARSCWSTSGRPGALRASRRSLIPATWSSPTATKDSP